MKFLADENVERQVIAHLRSKGIEILYIAEMAPGISDENVLKAANEKKAILITSDKDFGELVFRQNRTTHGIVLLRLSGIPNADRGGIVERAITEHSKELPGNFTVISLGTVRVRRSV